MGSPKESLEQKNIFTEKYDEIRRLDGIELLWVNIPKRLIEMKYFWQIIVSVITRKATFISRDQNIEYFQ